MAGFLGLLLDGGERTRSFHLAEAQLRRLADDLQRPIRVLDARELDDDVLGSRSRDVGFLRAERVHAVADDVHGPVEDLGARLALGREHHREAALQIKAELRPGLEDDDSHHAHGREQNDEHEGQDVPTGSLHYAVTGPGVLRPPDPPRLE